MAMFSGAWDGEVVEPYEYDPGEIVDVIGSRRITRREEDALEARGEFEAEVAAEEAS